MLLYSPEINGFSPEINGFFTVLPCSRFNPAICRPCSLPAFWSFSAQSKISMAASDVITVTSPVICTHEVNHTYHVTLLPLTNQFNFANTTMKSTWKYSTRLKMVWNGHTRVSKQWPWRAASSIPLSCGKSWVQAPAPTGWFSTPVLTTSSWWRAPQLLT